MNLYELFLVLLSIGLFITVLPFLPVFLYHNNTLMEVWIYFFAIGSALMGGGIGCAVGHITYLKKEEMKT